MDLTARGWKKVDDLEDSVPRVAVWRKGWEPFCVELELWSTGEIRGRLAAPGLAICGNMIFCDLPSVEDAVNFLEKLLVGATAALPIDGNGSAPQI
jgi:hypothetical protein